MKNKILLISLAIALTSCYTTCPCESKYYSKKYDCHIWSEVTPPPIEDWTMNTIDSLRHASHKKALTINKNRKYLLKFTK